MSYTLNNKKLSEAPSIKLVALLCESIGLYPDMANDNEYPYYLTHHYIYEKPLTYYLSLDEKSKFYKDLISVSGGKDFRKYNRVTEEYFPEFEININMSSLFLQCNVFMCHENNYNDQIVLFKSDNINLITTLLIKLKLEIGKNT